MQDDQKLQVLSSLIYHLQSWVELEYILLIKVLVGDVILVVCIVRGANRLVVIISKKLVVAGSRSTFKRSILKSLAKNNFLLSVAIFSINGSMNSSLNSLRSIGWQ